MKNKINNRHIYCSFGCEYARDSYQKAEEQLEVVNERFKIGSAAKNEVSVSASF